MLISELMDELSKTLAVCGDLEVRIAKSGNVAFGGSELRYSKKAKHIDRIRVLECDRPASAERHLTILTH